MPIDLYQKFGQVPVDAQPSAEPKDLFAGREDVKLPTPSSIAEKYATDDYGFSDDEKQMIGQLFTEDELKEIEKQEPMGFVEALRGKGWHHMLPYVGTGEDIGQGTADLEMINKAKNGDPSAINYVKDMMKKDLAAQMRGTTYMGKVGNILHYAPGFIGEMVGAYFTLGGGAAPQVAKAGTTQAVKTGVKSVAKNTIKKLAKGSAKATAMSLAMPQMTTKNYLDRRIAGSIEMTDKGELMLKDAEEMPATTALKAFGDTWVEVASEMSGETIMAGAGKVLSPVKKVASPVAAKMGRAIPAKVKDTLLREVKKFKPDASISRMLSDKVYFNGVLGEMGEERLGDILRVSLGLDNSEKPTVDKYLDAIFPDKEQLLAEAGAFSIIGGASHSAVRVYNGLVARGFSDAQARQTLDNMTEMQKEDMANKIGIGNQTIIETQEVPLEKIKLSNDIPNFKEGANEKGVVAGEQLQGKYDRLGTAPIVLWERENGDLEVITGRHRLDLAQRNGEATIPSQIIKESDGFTAEQAHLFDVEQNIKDGKGTVKDYVRFFKESDILDDEISERGLTARSLGRMSYDIAKNGSDSLTSLFLDGKITDAKAAAIASGAPSNEAAQAAGVKAAKKMSADELKAYVSILNTKQPIQTEGKDLFGFDDSNIKEAEAIAKLVAKDKAAIDAKIYAVKGALRNPQAAQEMGLKFEATPENIGKEVDKLNFEKDALDKFYTNPQLMAFYRSKINAKATGELVEPETDKLKIWFGDSKIVDKDGKPKPLYHGRTTNWDIFDPEKSSPYSLFGQAFYATDSKEIGEIYKGGVLGKETADANVLTVYVKMEHPYDLEEKITDKEIADLHKLVKNDTNYSFHWKRITDGVDPNTPYPDGIDLDENSINPDYVNRADLQKIKDWLVKNDKNWKDNPAGVLTRGDVYSILTDTNSSIAGKKALNKFLLKDYDGITYKQKGTGLTDRESDIEHNVYVVFDKFQIKAVDSESFNPDDPNIHAATSVRSYLPEYTPQNVEKINTIKRIPSDLQELAEQHDNYANPFWERKESKMQKFKSAWTDHLEPLRELSESIYKDARLYAGVGGKIAIAISDYTEDLNGNKTGEGLMPIINDFKKEFGVNQRTLEEDLGGYMIAQRYADLANRSDVHVSDEQLNSVMEIYEGLKKKYGEDIIRFDHYAERIYDYQKRVAHLLVESGLMSQNAYDAMLEKNPHYVPFYRILDKEKIPQPEAVIKNAKGKGVLKARPTIKKIKGSDLDIRNPFASIVNNTASIITNAHKNAIVKSVASLRKTHPDLVKNVDTPKASYDKGLRDLLKEGIKKLGGTYERTDRRLTKDNAFGVYLPFENKIKEKIGSDAALAHEFGHMLDHKLGLGAYILQNEQIEEELMDLADERIGAYLTEENGRFKRTIKDAPQSYKKYLYSHPELIANLYDAYINAPELLAKKAPTAKALMDKFVSESKNKWLQDIHRTLDVGFEEFNKQMENDKGVISYYDNGQKKFIRVHEDMYKALNGVDTIKIPTVLKLFTSFPARLLRWGATQANITFALIRNPLRDTTTAAMQTRVGFIPIVDTLRGAKNVLLDSEAYKDWKRNGGSFDSFMQINENSKLNPYKELFESGFKFKYLNPFFYVEKMGELFEEGTRVGVYNKAIQKGLTPKEAAFISRDSTLDFARGGTIAKNINQFVPFFNANIQGLVSMSEKFKKHPVEMSLKAIAELTLPSMAIAYYYTKLAPDDEQEEYAEIPTWQKNMFWNIKYNGKWITIPKPFAYGAIFATLPQAMVEGITTDADIDWVNQAKNIYDNLNVVGDISGVLPPIPKLILELQQNKSFYTGQDIVPTYLVDVDPEEQFTDRTSELAKELGKLGISPIKAEHTITTLGAGLMKDFLNLADMTRNAVKEDKPARETGEMPILRGFISREPTGYNSMSVQKFMDEYDKLEIVNNTLKKKEREDAPDIDDYADKHEKELDLFEELKGYHKEIKDLTTEINDISKDDSMSPSEKRKELRDLRKEMTSVAREALDAIKEY